MKILVVQDYLRSGGTERQAILLAQSFQKAGHDVTLLTFRPGGVLAPKVAPVFHQALQPFDSHLDWWAPGLTRFAKNFAPDVVLCLGRMANCWAGGLQLFFERKKLRTAVVGTMRTGKTLPRLFRRSLHRVSHIVANSNDSRELLLGRYGVEARKVSVIHNGLVFPATDRPATLTSQLGEAKNQSREAVRAQHGATEITVVLLSVGMFRPEKNQREAIEIVRRLPGELDWQLWLAGDGPERGDVEALAKSLGLEHRVKFLGFTEDPTPLYGAADIAVLTSRSESLSNFLIEAHAHGLPSVAYGVAGVPECGGIAVKPQDAAAFLAALLPLMRHAVARRAEGARVAAYASEHFSPDQQAGAYLQLFQKLRAR
jgi:glycosyltransferase involved in cell wall biosynthesis